MTYLTKTFAPFTLLILMFSASLPLCARTINETFAVDPDGTLDLRTDGGSITIRTHDSNNIQMEVKIRGFDEDEFTVSTKVNSGNLTIRGEKHERWGYNRQVRYTLVVPKRYNLDLDTSGGSINISDLSGNVKAHTSGGAISVGNIQGDVLLDTSGGSIDVASVSGGINARTSGGRIDVTISEPLTQDAELKTSGGTIRAAIASNSKLDINASTSGGKVHSDFEVDGRVKKRSIRGKINGGGPELTLRTSGGSIYIESN